MAGLISQQMQPADGMSAGQVPPGEEQENEDLPDDPNFDAAIEYLNQVLYGDKAAKEISQQLKSAPNLADAMASVAYDITSILDEKTNGDVPDELLAPMAMKVLEEVVEIADASGVDPTPEDVASAFKQMILRFLKEQGLDTAQLEQAMNQVDPSVFRKMAEEKIEEV